MILLSFFKKIPFTFWFCVPLDTHWCIMGFVHSSNLLKSVDSHTYLVFFLIVFYIVTKNEIQLVFWSISNLLIIFDSWSIVAIMNEFIFCSPLYPIRLRTSPILDFPFHNYSRCNVCKRFVDVRWDFVFRNIFHRTHHIPIFPIFHYFHNQCLFMANCIH